MSYLSPKVCPNIILLLLCVKSAADPRIIFPRRKKCDETYPICGHCTRLNLVCNREAPQHIAIEKGALPSPSTPTLPTSWALTTIPRAPDPIDICTFTDSPQGTNQRFLLRYYTNILSNLLTTNHENNSFLSGTPNEYNLFVADWCSFPPNGSRIPCPSFRHSRLVFHSPILLQQVARAHSHQSPIFRSRSPCLIT
jgi:hypothetical protein